jgi:uncharacterized membrane protein YgcG
MEILLILLVLFIFGIAYWINRDSAKGRKDWNSIMQELRTKHDKNRHQERDAQIQRALARKEALTGPQHPFDVTNELPNVFVMHSMVFNELLKRGQIASYVGLVNVRYERTFCGVPIVVDDNQPCQTTWKDIIEASRAYKPIKHVSAVRQSDRVTLHIGHKGDGAQWPTCQQSAPRQEDDTLSNVLLASVLVNSLTDNATSVDIPATQNDNFSGGEGEFGGGGASESWDSSPTVNSGPSNDSGSFGSD